MKQADMSIPGYFAHLVLLLLIGASPVRAQMPDALSRGLEAHGGLEVWQAYRGLRFDFLRGDQRETHTIELTSRRTRQQAASFTIGFDGDDVWVTPGLDAFNGNARFYNGLQFYFFAMPFVLADPGVNAAALGRRTIEGAVYDVVEITFGEHVGDSPKDTYLAHFDPSSGLLRLLLYTVTFSSQAPSTSFNALRYDEWQEVGGLLVPRRVSSFGWDGDREQLGAQRSTSRFENVSLAREAPDEALFERPDGADIAPPSTPAAGTNR